MEQLNERISFVYNENTFNQNGFSVVTEVEFYKCWANYKTLSAKEFNSAYTNNSEIVSSFKVRYCSKIKEIDQLIHKIRFKDKIYNIVWIDDSNKDYWYFKAVSVNGDA